MVLLETRVILPLTIDEFKIGYVYTQNRLRKQNSDQKLNVVDIKSHCYQKPGTNVQSQNLGLYTRKNLKILSSIPSWVFKIVPREKILLETQCWNEYPEVVTTLYHLPFLGKRVSFSLEQTVLADDDGKRKNVFKLNRSELKERKILQVDICDDKITDCLGVAATEDPKRVKNSRCPLRRGWQIKKPHICVYNVFRVDVNIWGIQTKAEQLILDNIREVYLKILRFTVCWMNDWIELLWNDMLALEGVNSEEILQWTLPSNAVKLDNKDHHSNRSISNISRYRVPRRQDPAALRAGKKRSRLRARL